MSIIRGLIVASLCLGGCTKSDEDAPTIRQTSGKRVYDVEPIDTDEFTSEPEVRKKVLYMPFGEAAARLGSLAISAKSRVVFTRGNDEIEQVDHTTARYDPEGNFFVHLKTPKSEVEFYQIGENAFVRLDRGHLRRKLRTHDSETWGDLAFSGIHQALELLRGRHAFTDPRVIDHNGRKTLEFDLVLADTPQEDVGPHEAERGLPIPPPTRWRELATPLDLTGKLQVDEKTGVVVGMNLAAKLEVADREVRPTQITFQYEATLDNIGKVPTITAPKHVDEYLRTPPPQDLLSFFRDQLPQEEEAK